ncbi:MAG: YccF domain-containing protein [bacterium]
MRLLGNIIWFVFGGFLMGLGWMLAALISFITIIGIPFGVAAFRIAIFSFWPFGRKIIDKPDTNADKSISLIGNIIWFILCGWWLAIGELIAALISAITIIGIPFALQHLKLAGLALMPFGKQIVEI